MYLIDPTKDVLSLVQQVFTIGAALVGILVARRWQRELRGQTRHEAARDTITEVFNIRNMIAVARRSWRTVFFTQDPSKLKDPQTVAEFERLAEAEKIYWETHLSQIEAAGVTFRNASIIPETIWKEKFTKASDALKESIDSWTSAVTTRIESLTLFLQTTQPDYLNTNWSPILVSDHHYLERYFEESAIMSLKSQSLDYWDKLDAACKGIRYVVESGFMN